MSLLASGLDYIGNVLETISDKRVREGGGGREQGMLVLFLCVTPLSRLQSPQVTRRSTDDGPHNQAFCKTALSRHAKRHYFVCRVVTQVLVVMLLEGRVVTVAGFRR